MIEKEKDISANADLNKHSALTNYKSVGGKKMPVSVYKAIQAIYSKEQKVLKENYRKEAISVFSKVFPKNKIDIIMESLYSNKPVELSATKINELNLIEFSIDAFKQRIDSVNWGTLDNNTLKDKLARLKESPLVKIALHNIDTNALEYKEFVKINNKTLGLSKNKTLDTEEITEMVYTNESLNALVSDIKSYAKDITVKKSMSPQVVDYSLLSKMIGVNITRLKKDLTDAVSNYFEFNFINKRKIDIDIKAAMLASVKFKTGSGVMSLEYQIPVEILKLLLLPDMFAEIKSKISFKFESTYSYDLYQFLKDNLYKGRAVLQKEELFDFLNVPAKARKYRNYLETQIIAPVKAELEMNSDISIDYQFFPERNWTEIQFIIRSNNKYKDEVLEVRKLKEELKVYTDNERITRAVEKVRRNIYVNRSWNKRAENKVNKMYNEYGEDFVVLILNKLYSSLNDGIKTTLIQYINGMIKNVKAEARQSKKRLTKQMLDKSLEVQIHDINEDIIPELKTLDEFNLFLNSLPRSSKYKTEINEKEHLKLVNRLMMLDKSIEFIERFVETYFIINKNK